MTNPDLVAIPQGQFVMGADAAPHPEDGEGPARRITLGPYQISSTAVSNADFATFVEATGYQTQAEQRGGSQVFKGRLQDPDAHRVLFADAPWWRLVKGASWRRPDGVTAADPHHPVVHVSHTDARAYCHWAGARLPTEAEWENAALPQGGITPHIWQGRFPDAPLGTPNTKAVRDAAPNEHGLYHACGNVWEWVADRFSRLHSPRPDQDPKGALNGALHVVKGGSYLCAPSYCARYRPSSRRGEMPEASTCHLGFRISR